MRVDWSTTSSLAALVALIGAQACAGRYATAPAPALTAQPSKVPATLENSPPAPHILLHVPEVLARHKARWLADQQHPEPAVARLFHDARKALGEKPFSVTEKSEVPPSGDKHDYLSLAPYAWPDPRRPDELPYIMRDGRINPERDTIADHAQFSRIVALTETLGLAYYFTGDENYAHHAALLLRTFFLDPATRMNPNLNFAQGVRGKESGRASGIIDTAGIARLVDGTALVMDSPAFSKEDRDGLLAWFRDYLAWLRESELGRKEGQARNNHGAWYDVQVASLALATGDVDLARETLQFARKRRIGRQIDSDGRQPEELQRTRSWHYAIFNLQALVALANLGERVGVGLWRYQTQDGRSIRKAIDWLVPFALGDARWPTPEISGMRPAELWPVLREAADRLHDTQLSTAAAHLGADLDDRLWLFVE